MYSLQNLLSKEPVAISAAVVALVNLLSLFGVISLTTDQLAGLNTVLVLILGLFSRQSVTPNAKL